MTRFREPTLREKAANFWRASRRMMTAAKPLCTLPEISERVKVCEACEHNKGVSCGVCGCLIHLKAAYATEHCPVRKW